MMTYDDASLICSCIEYKNWTLRLNREPFFLQWVFAETEGIQRSRKWLLSEYMTRSEIVGTALKAALTAEEHEGRESFRYKGKKIFGPHFDVDRLVDLARYKDNLDIRENQLVAVGE